jgi:hypothetical protein
VPSKGFDLFSFEDDTGRIITLQVDDGLLLRDTFLDFGVEEEGREHRIRKPNRARKAALMVS